jgi:hypothetical protein
LTQEQLDRDLIEWQSRLRLRDWKLVARMVPAHELPDKAGECNSFNHTKEAVVKISDNSNNPHSIIAAYHPWNDEETLVHELLELHFDPFKEARRGPKYDSQELALNVIAEALVELRHGNGHSIQNVLVGADEDHVINDRS